jgi:hypothetical protein
VAELPRDDTRQVIEPDDEIGEQAVHWLIGQEEPGFTSEDRRQMVAWLDADPEHRRVYEDVITKTNRATFIGERMRDRGLEYSKKFFRVVWAIYDRPQAHPEHWGVRMSCGPWFDPKVHLFVELEDARAHIAGQGGVLDAAPSEPGIPEFWSRDHRENRA